MSLRHYSTSLLYVITLKKTCKVTNFIQHTNFFFSFFLFGTLFSLFE